MRRMIYLLYDEALFSKQVKVSVIASSDQLDVILNLREEFPKASFYSYESSNEGCERHIMGRIKCHRCNKRVIIVDNEIPRGFPFCSKICQSIDLLYWLKMGKDDQMEDEIDDSIE